VEGNQGCRREFDIDQRRCRLETYDLRVRQEEQMDCTQIYDFIRGTTIPLPGPPRLNSDHHAHLDVLRPSKEAEELVSRHIEKLEAFRL